MTMVITGVSRDTSRSRAVRTSRSSTSASRANINGSWAVSSPVRRKLIAIGGKSPVSANGRARPPPSFSPTATRPTAASMWLLPSDRRAMPSASGRGTPPSTRLPSTRAKRAVEADLTSTPIRGARSTARSSASRTAGRFSHCQPAAAAPTRTAAPTSP